MRFLVSAAGCLCALTALAANTTPAGKQQPDWYSVQVLVFRYTGPNAAQGETWPATVPAPSLAGAVYPATGARAAYARLGPVASPIARARSRLAAASGYAPVTVLAWREPGLDADAARPVSLAPLPASVAAAGTVAGAGSARARAPGRMDASPSGTATAPVRVEGTATLAVANAKPHIALDLRLCEPPPPGLDIQAPVAATASSTAAATAATAFTLLAPEASAPAAMATAAGGPPQQCFAMHQQRQVEAGKLEYFDHPAFGVLVLVNPVTPPAGAATGTRAATGPG